MMHYLTDTETGGQSFNPAAPCAVKEHPRTFQAPLTAAVSFPSRDTDRNERFGPGEHNPDQ